MHLGSLDKMGKFVSKYLEKYKEETVTILDVGSQDVNGSYKSFFNHHKWNYTGCDMVEGRNVDLVLKNIYNWTEIDNDSYDVIVSGQVFEHVEYLWVTILEMARVLKEGGICCIIAPSNGFEHKYPVDCWRIYPDGFRALAKYAGLKVIEAYTQWQDAGYTDGSDIWKDSVLVCQKPALSDEERQEWNHKNCLAKVIAGISVESDKLDDAYAYFAQINRKSTDLKSILGEIEKEINIDQNIEKINDFPIENVIQTIKRDITNKTTLLNGIAIINFNKERYDNVIPYLNAALEIDGSNSDALYNLGFVLNSMGESELALTYFNRITDKDENLVALINKLSAGKKEISEGKKEITEEKKEAKFYVDPSCDIRGGDRIRLGDNVVIQKDCWLNIAHDNQDREVMIEIGEGTNVGRRCTISAANKIKIGNNVLMAPNVFIADTSHEYKDPSMPILSQGITTVNNEIHIGDGTWLGTNSVVIGNLRIGKGCVIGANSVVNKDIPDYCVAVGNPANIVKVFDAVQDVWVKIESKEHLEQVLDARCDAN